MKNFLPILLLLTLLLGCDKSEKIDINSPLTASIVLNEGKVNLVLSTEELFSTPGFTIESRESSSGSKQIVNLKYIYKRANTVLQVMSPATVFLYATAEPEQKFTIRYKGKTANLTIRNTNNTFTIESDNESFIRP